MNIKKIENQEYKMNGEYIDNIEKELRADGFTFEEDTIVFEDLFSISSSDDEINLMKKAEIVYVDEKRYYAVIKDELGDYAICSLKNDSSSKLKEFIEENISSEENDDFESFDVNFKIVSNRNPEVYTEGYVTINDETAEDVDWYYYDAQGMPTSQMFIEHDGVDGFRGATDEQKWEVEQFRGDYGEDAFWIDTCILQSNDDENRTHVRENLTLLINEGIINNS